MGKRILVTGATGFVGSNIVRRFVGDNEVHILTRESSDMWRLKDLLELESLKKHDVELEDFSGLKSCLEEISPEIIIHTAVYGGFPGEKDVEKIVRTNIQGTINLLEASKEINYEYFINTGSSSEYGMKNTKMKEDDLLEPNTEYGVAKSASTLFATHFAKKNGKSIVTLRLFSPFGPFEAKSRLMPYVALAAINKSVLKIGNPDSARDFIFIEDVVCAYERIISSGRKFKGEIFNVCSGRQRSVREVVETVSEIIGVELGMETDESKKRVYDATLWVGDNSKIKKEIGWVPALSFSEGLKKNIGWFKKNAEQFY